MSDDLDKSIFDEFVKLIADKKILSGNRIAELKGFFNKQNVSAQDWDLLVDKECFPPKVANDAKQN